jgi:transcriptional regulator with XRE-family HTH domain
MTYSFCLPTTKGLVIPLVQERFGDWLRRTREARGFSLRGLADRAGITHPTISQIENHKTGATRDMVRKLAEGLGVPASDAVRAWLEDDTQEGGAITYVTDPDVAELVEAYEGAADRDKELVKTLLAKAREMEKEKSVGGKRADRDEQPSRTE